MNWGAGVWGAAGETLSSPAYLLQITMCFHMTGEDSSKGLAS